MCHISLITACAITAADGGGESVADVLVIDELQDTEPLAHSPVNQNDVCNANCMVVLPARVSVYVVFSRPQYVM